MRSLFFVAVVVLVGIAGVGFYRGWFGLSTNGTDPRPSATITVDQDKIHADEAKVQEFGHETKEKFSHSTETAK